MVKAVAQLYATCSLLSSWNAQPYVSFARLRFTNNQDSYDQKVASRNSGI